MLANRLLALPDMDLAGEFGCTSARRPRIHDVSRRTASPPSRFQGSISGVEAPLTVQISSREPYMTDPKMEACPESVHPKRSGRQRKFFLISNGCCHTCCKAGNPASFPGATSSRLPAELPLGLPPALQLGQGPTDSDDVVRPGGACVCW